MAIYPTFLLSIQYYFAKPLCGTAKIQKGNLLADASVSFLCRLTQILAKDLFLKLDTQICYVCLVMSQYALTFSSTLLQRKKNKKIVCFWLRLNMMLMKTGFKTTHTIKKSIFSATSHNERETMIQIF